MSSTDGIETVDRRNITKSWLTGTRLPIIAVVSLMSLFGLGLSEYLSVSPDGEFVQIDLNMSFRDVPCKFTSIHVHDAFGRNMLNVTKTFRKYPIDSETQEFVEEYADGSLVLNSSNLNTIQRQYPILGIMYWAPNLPWSNHPESAYVEAAKIMRKRYGTETGKGILVGEVASAAEVSLNRRKRTQNHKNTSHDSYIDNRDGESLLKMMQDYLIPQISLRCYYLDMERKFENAKRGCRIEGSVRAKKVTKYLTASTHSAIDGARARVYIVFKTTAGIKFLDH